jgi:hypothetical protein
VKEEFDIMLLGRRSEQIKKLQLVFQVFPVDKLKIPRRRMQDMHKKMVQNHENTRKIFETQA